MSKRALALVSLGAALLVLAVLAMLGSIRVADDEVVLHRDSEGEVAALAPGVHFRFRGSLLRLPRTPVGLDKMLQLQETALGPVIVSVAGEFRLARNDSYPSWLAGAGFVPLEEGLDSELRELLETAVARLSLESLFRAETRDRLARAVERRLQELGVEAQGLSLVIPRQDNGELVEALRQEVEALATPTKKKVLVVGWDGADWLMMEPLLKAGRLPNVASLVDRGVSAELRSEMPLLSPLVWTTIATGKPVLEHGIADFLVRDPASDELVPISSASRRVHALWTLTSELGLDTDVVAWWATWPAETINGTLVSDRVAYQLFDVDTTDEGGKVYPPEAWSQIATRLKSAEEIDAKTLRRFVDVSPEEVDKRWRDLPAERRQEDRINHLRKILATTESYHQIALSLLADQADLTLVYYEATDTVGHLFARYLPPRMPGVTGDDVRRFGHALPEMYAYVDELLGELIAAADPETLVLLISDHGFFTGAARPAADPSDFGAGAPQWHRLYGVLVAAGPGVEAGAIDQASIFDIAPTVLASLGLPVPQDMHGRVLAEIAGSPLRQRQLASYESLPRQTVVADARSAALDRERVRELAALGYVDDSEKPSTSAATTGSAGTVNVEAKPDALEGIVTEAYNRGRIQQRQGNLDQAREQYRLAIERMPGFGPGWASLAQVETLEGHHCQAFETLGQGLAVSSNLPNAALTGLVDEAANCGGRLEEADRVLRSLDRSYQERSAYHSALGLLSERRGELTDALEEFHEALRIDPLDQLANEQRISLLRRAGRDEEARQAFDGAASVAAGQVTAMNQLAIVALRQGWPREAEDLLRQVLASDPGNPGVLANLAASLMQQGRKAEALEAMRQSVARNPSDARNQFNLGALLAEQQEIDAAIEAFEAAISLGLRNTRVHVALSKMYFRKGDRQAAESELERAIAIEPADPEARQLLEILRSAPPG